jgi:hypothetical protein
MPERIQGREPPDHFHDRTAVRASVEAKALDGFAPLLIRPLRGSSAKAESQYA